MVREKAAALAQTGIEYPPIKNLASFNLDVVKKKIEGAIKADQAD